MRPRSFCNLRIGSYKDFDQLSRFYTIKRVFRSHHRYFNATSLPPNSGNKIEVTDSQKTQSASASVKGITNEYINIIKEGRTEIVLYNLLLDENFPVATSLMATAISHDYTISNQLWSFFVSQCCLHADYEGCTLCYDQIISPSSESLYFPSNQIPFLLSVEQLVGLGSIFARNFDVAKAHGILLYFKRFYSYIGHKHAFADLRSHLVEAGSGPNASYQETLKLFIDLAHIFQPEDISDKAYAISKEKIFSNYRWRRHAIRSNTHSNYDGLPNSHLDQEEASVAEMQNSRVFRPFILRNNYSTPDLKSYPLIKGCIKTSDLPNFYMKTHKTVSQLMQSENSDKVGTLLDFVSRSHKSLHVFVFRSLCEQHHFEAALSFFYAFMKYSHYKNREILVIFFHFIKQRIEENFNGDLFQRCTELMEFFKNKYNSQIVGQYIDIMLLSSQATPAQIQPFLNQLQLKDVVYLEKQTFEKFQSMFGNIWDHKVKLAVS